jgi:hypothetical protein
MTGFASVTRCCSESWAGIAFVEPNPRLCAGIRANRTAGVFECAASDRNGTATLHVGMDSDLLSTLEGGAARDRLRRESREITLLSV